MYQIVLNMRFKTVKRELAHDTNHVHPFKILEDPLQRFFFNLDRESWIVKFKAFVMLYNHMNKKYS